MPDIRERFSALDHIDVPDLRTAIEGRDVHGVRSETAREPSTARRALIACIALAVAAAAFLVLTDAFRRGTYEPAGHPPPTLGSPQPPRWVVEQALSTAASFGDPDPASAEWILTSRRSIAHALYDQVPGGGQLEYLVVMHGRFTDPFKIGPLPPSPIVALTLDPRTRQTRASSWELLGGDLAGLQPLLLHPTPATLVTSTIVIDHVEGADLYPPPVGAGPGLTADQAIARFEAADPAFKLPGDAEVFLGEYSGSPITNDQLAYGIRFHRCPAISVDPFSTVSSSPSTSCTYWLFLNADTGTMLEARAQTG